MVQLSTFQISVTCALLEMMSLVVCSLHTTRFQHSTVYANHTCLDNDTLFTIDVSNELTCVTKCAVLDNCYSVFYSEDSNTCYGCATMYYSTNLPETADRSSYYHTLPGMYAEAFTCFVIPFFKRSTFVGSAWSFGFFIPTTMTSDFEGFLSQILSITFFVLSLFFRKSQYFPF